MASALRQAVERVLGTLRDGVLSENDRIRRLIAGLDELALLSHRVKPSSGEPVNFEMPEQDYSGVRTAIASCFPSLGYYNIANDVATCLTQSTLSVGDAIDDLTDIAIALIEVTWLYHNASEAEAEAYFLYSFRIHWEWHLREVQLYLHDFSRHVRDVSA